MKFYKFFIVLLLCAILATNPIGSEFLDSDTEITTLKSAVIPLLSNLVGNYLQKVPIGPILVKGLGFLNLALVILTAGDGGDDKAKALINLDIMKSESQIFGAVDNVGSSVIEQSKKIISELTHAIESTILMEDMRSSMASMQRTYADKMKIIMDPKVTGVQKNATISSMLNYDSPYMVRLRSFCDNYIKPSINIPSAGPFKLFFELILQKDNLLAIENDDCYKDSMHSKIFKAYMFISKVLTDGYVMPIVAHTMQYQTEIKSGLTSDAEATKANAKELIENYKNDMKVLIEKTKWALENASRDIKNCGSFKLEKGKTFERLTFAQTIPRIMHISTNGCKEEAGAFNLKDFETGNCNTYGDILRPNSQVSIFRDPKDLDRPYQYMKVITPTGNKEIFGHNSSNSNLIQQQIKIDDRCPTIFCPAFKKNAVAISTKRISADYGNAITGLRFRVEDGILYIDIQQGKFNDILSVDPSTLYWTKTPAGGPVKYLSANERKLELGNFRVEGNGFLKSIQLKPGNARYGTVNIYVEGASGPNWYSSSPVGSIDKIPESNELLLPKGDDPDKAGNNLIYLISQPPHKGERYYVSLQPSDMKADMGRTNCPMIDIREVVSDPPAPISGFGIYHEGAKNSCGFIALKLETPKLDHLVDFSQIEKFTDSVKTA